ncbi:asparagine synthase (glutamine-hydrolysing) [Pseudomonas sp. NFPP10]|nr:asparagine synthase (glutamine-hydrolysing) [Pseudomonas sp. NFPP12]SEL56541.1 asparagine synthase (glutamine-hydrolysing) [Pseudomonas sp. NFPP10]SEQ46574.1 asparagine synthase (glutamine-hydrolysing) [Pseudomonas sp. NFPP19]SFJ24978.1 asparagine synthase (glutamine-hydrolysing) [Pseudomonas sp. NFPP08]SFM77830.1 asparagine synthase (glutamine-hydrolysing) [Pseudomonas sp. NFPP05]SFX55128.1 asparagine synthase (glutamine-hydrolysing) [Pseudomonas sp. NFPP09]
MMAAIRHRGPDDDGIWLDDQRPVGLGHVRLAIIDPENGKQPMVTEDGRYILVFNGAIYNYLELRRELISKGHPIHSYSDTEVLLYAYREWGERCLTRLQGMFALAIWDKAEQKLFCARDRLGIKPFYYSFDGQRLMFASEIKALLADESVQAQTNSEGLQDYLTFQFCLDEKTLFKGINKLEPGYCLTAWYEDSALKLKLHQYWDLQYNIDEEHDERYFIDTLSGLLDDSIRLHMRSDLPLGAHLSGGLDSSSIVCLASRMLGGEQMKTFTGAFSEGPQFDETAYAKEVSSFAGTDYNEIYISGHTLPDILPKLMYYMDEPLAGPGAIPQYYVSQLASNHVKVVMGGQGGDELFIGYARYMAAYLEKCLSGAINQTAHQRRYAVSLESIVPNLPLLGTYQPMLQSLWRDGLFGPADERYFRLVDRSEGMSQLFNQESLRGTSNYSSFDSFQRIFNRPELHSLVNQMTYFDLKGSLPALLHVEDRTSMANSIESRVPLLDHRIVEFLATIPPNIKFSGGRVKHLFKESVRSAVPPNIFHRKDKMGFPTPLTQWTKGVARDFVRDTLLSDRARQRGLYHIPAVEQALSNEREFGRVVWGLLCLELWHCIFIDGDMKPSGI